MLHVVWKHRTRDIPTLCHELDQGPARSHQRVYSTLPSAEGYRCRYAPCSPSERQFQYPDNPLSHKMQSKTFKVSFPWEEPPSWHKDSHDRLLLVLLLQAYPTAQLLQSLVHGCIRVHTLSMRFLRIGHNTRCSKILLHPFKASWS